jgi:hypothetical protein
MNMTAHPSGAPATARVTFDGVQTPAHSIATVNRVGIAAMLVINRRRRAGPAASDTPALAVPAHTAATAAPEYSPMQRAQTGS